MSRFEIVALQQIQKDSKILDNQAIPVGPFARLDANAVAAQHGKTRGAITNLFGSQTAFQAETMALALSARDWVSWTAQEPAGTSPCSGARARAASADLPAGVRP
jgi:hypothetical protein